MPHTTGGAVTTWVFIVVKTLILVGGGTITYYSYKAYRRTEDRSLGLLAGGFASITLGAFLGGAAFELLGTSLTTGIIVEGVFVLIGFGLIAGSLRIGA